MRLVSGETLEELSRELGVAAHELSRWREQYEVGGRAALKGRAADAGDVEVKRLKEKIGELTMDNELLYERIHAMEAGSPFAGMRPKR
jgi:transposase-like protein